MKKTPKISIVIPIYNVEEYIAECLQSVMRQTYKGEIECILVDDCGKDNSIFVAEKLITDYKGPIAFRILHHERNRGLSAARNTGTDAATGDYIYYLDSDDYISDDCLEVLAEPLKDREYDMVVGDYKAFGGEWNAAQLDYKEGAVVNKQEISEALYYKFIYVMAWNKLLSLQLQRKNNIRFIEGILHEDEPWTFELSTILSSIYVVDIKTYYYRIRTDSIVGKCKSKEKANHECSSYVQIVKNVLRIAALRKVGGEAYEALINYLVNLTLYIGFENHINTKSDYYAIRKLYKRPNGIALFLENVKVFRKRLHWYLPKRIAYSFLIIKYKKNHK